MFILWECNTFLERADLIMLTGFSV